MKKSLFRKEVLESRRGSWLGGISLAQPLALWVWTSVAVAVVVAIALFVTLAEYTRRSRVVGQLVPSLGLSTVVAPTSGVVDRIFQDEGERVAAAGSLVLISVPRTTAAGQDTQAAVTEGIKRRRASVEQSRESGTDLLEAQRRGQVAQLQIARRELAQIDQQVRLRDEQVRLAETTLRRYQDLEASRYVSSVDVVQQQQAVLEQRAARQALVRQGTTTRQTIAQLEQALREVPARIAMQEAGSARDLAVLDQEMVQAAAAGSVLVNAPVAGLVASRLVQPGQSVQAGQVLMSLLPRGSLLEAQLLIPSRAIGFVEPGDKVLLRYQAFPYQKFGHHEGKVVRISRSALSSGELGTLVGNVQGGEPMYRVLVRIDSQSVMAFGKSEPLRPGMLVEADILGERRKLYEWALEPLYALTGKIGH